MRLASRGIFRLTTVLLRSSISAPRGMIFMPNPHVVQRLVGIQQILAGVHQASASLSSSSRGNEREAFNDEFLSNVLPPIYRFGTGRCYRCCGQSKRWTWT